MPDSRDKRRFPRLDSSHLISFTHFDASDTPDDRGMAKTLDLNVVAEGVETREQVEFLRSLACDEMQGYYFSKPIDPDQIALLLRQRVDSPV